MRLANRKKEHVATLLAEDRFPDRRIADIVGVTSRTIDNWKTEPEMQARVAELTKQFSDRVLKFGLARRERRLQVLCDMHDRILDVIDARAADESLKNAPGAKTGLMTLTIRSVGYGPKARMVPEYAVDTATLRELRAVQEQISKELGQWTEKREVTGKDGAPLFKEPTTQAEIDERLKVLLAEAGLVAKPRGEEDGGTDQSADVAAEPSTGRDEQPEGTEGTGV
jgi:hypothetical protein